MANERLTIGELSRRSGIAVKTLRFYSDEGLLPPAERSQSGYRLYGDEALVRLDLVRTLREAGLGLESIKKVLARETSLADALRLRLAAVEAHIVSLQRIKAALRAALRSEPNEADVRRLCAVTRLSHEERKSVIEGFYDRATEGLPVDPEWKKEMIDASTPKLPDDATPEQLDAWVELTELVADPSLIENMRKSAGEIWGKVDMNVMRRAGEEMTAAAREAMARSAEPSSEEARGILERYAEGMREARGAAAVDDAIRSDIRRRFEDHDPRGTRYWELVAIINESPKVESTIREWHWLTAAAVHHFPR